MVRFSYKLKRSLLIYESAVKNFLTVVAKIATTEFAALWNSSVINYDYLPFEVTNCDLIQRFAIPIWNGKSSIFTMVGGFGVFDVK